MEGTWALNAGGKEKEGDRGAQELMEEWRLTAGGGVCALRTGREQEEERGNRKRREGRRQAPRHGQGREPAVAPSILGGE